MCGIAGGFAFREEGRHYLDKLKDATCQISHRGPDGEGLFREGGVALGHRRLSIIDTSHEADQPMYTASGRYCMVFNGEIFNYQELKATYFRDFPLRTTSDTEVFLELFARKGPECFSELRGFFACAIYDRERNELFLARDRFGKKPVHIYQDEEVLLFASELRSLLAFGIRREIDKQVLPYYFQLNYIPQPLSILKGVHKLMPGHYLKLSATGAEQHAYFELRVRTEDYGQYTYDEAKGKLAQLMDDATRLRLIADVPLGAFLSGGIDSSVVVALASRYQQQLKTFSIGFKDQPYFDETKYANLVAKKYNTDHTVFPLTNNDLLSHIDHILDAIDEPFADSSLIPTFILSHETRKHVTVALSGDGGDEVFAGYNKYHAEMRMMQPSMARNMIRGMRPLWQVLPKSRSGRITNTIRQLHRFAEGASLQPGERYWKWASMFAPEASLALIRKSYQPLADAGSALHKRFPFAISGNDLNEVLLADMKLVLLGDMLVKVDMMSMANSLEVRSPFLDQDVVHFAFGLPAQYRIQGNFKKRIIQDTFRDLLPPELYNRPKQGFDIPLLPWFRKELRSLIEDDLLADRFIEEQGIFDLQTVQGLKKKLHSADPGDVHETIWALIVFQKWWRRHLA